MSLATTARVSARPPGIPARKPAPCLHANATAVGCRQQCCFHRKQRFRLSARFSREGGVSPSRRKRHTLHGKGCLVYGRWGCARPALAIQSGDSKRGRRVSSAYGQSGQLRMRALGGGWRQVVVPAIFACIRGGAGFMSGHKLRKLRRFHRWLRGGIRLRPHQRAAGSRVDAHMLLLESRRRFPIRPREPRLPSPESRPATRA